MYFNTYKYNSVVSKVFQKIMKLNCLDLNFSLVYVHISQFSDFLLVFNYNVHYFNMEYTNEKRENKQDNRENDDITLVQKKLV